MADFRQLAELLAKLAPAMARAGGSRLPAGADRLGPNALRAQQLQATGAEFGNIHPGIRPLAKLFDTPEGGQAAPRLNRIPPRGARQLRKVFDPETGRLRLQWSKDVEPEARRLEYIRRVYETFWGPFSE